MPRPAQFLPRPSDRILRHNRLQVVRAEDTALNYNIRLLHEYCDDVDAGLRDIFVKLRTELSITTNSMTEDSAQRTLSRAFRKLVDPGVFPLTEDDNKRIARNPGKESVPALRTMYREFCEELDSALYTAVIKDRKRLDRETPRKANEDPGLEIVLNHLKDALLRIELMGDLSRVAPTHVNRDEKFAKKTCDAHVGRAVQKSRQLKRDFVKAVWPIIRKINEIDPTIMMSQIEDKDDLARTATFGGEELRQLIPSYVACLPKKLTA
jgi:hypothetical protein